MSVKSTSCVLCDCILTDESSSREHLIPRAIGGRKKVKGFICRQCNSNAGRTWDAALAESLNPLSLLCKIKREGNEVPSQKFKFISGDEVVLKSDGSMTIPKPIFSKKEESGKVKIDIQARSTQEANEMLLGIKKKYPNFDIEAATKNLFLSEKYPEEPLHIQFQFGGGEVGRSLVKSALALAIENGISANDCNEALVYLKNANVPACFGYYYERDLIINRPKDTVLHCVAISNQNTQGQLLAYVEYFSAQRMIVRLSSNYIGENIHAMYAIDPINGKEVDLIFDLNLSHQDVQDAYDYKKAPDDARKAAIEIPISAAIRNDFDAERNRQLSEAVEYAFKNCGVPEGALIEEKDMRLIGHLLIERLTPFLVRHMRSGDRVEDEES